MKTLQTSIRNFAADSLPSLHEHRWLAMISVAYLFAAVLVSIMFGAPIHVLPLVIDSVTSTLLGLAFLFCAYAIFVMIFVRPARLTLFLLEGVRVYVTRERLLYALPMLLIIPVFSSAFGLFKAAIPFVNPFTFDIRIAEWDRLLHGGQHPWTLLQPLIGYPVVTAIINVCYHLWFFVMFAMLYWQTCSLVNRRLRMQFLLSFCFTWIFLGTVGATWLSSVGPCYYGYLIPGDNPFAPLMEYLRNANEHFPIWALDVQKLLWDGYQNRATETAWGVSAMPSLHIATSILFALTGWRISRSAGIALTLFAAIIMIGSVHLGWHYALDGYVGAAGAYAIWRFVGWMLSASQQAATAGTSLLPSAGS